MANTHTVTNRGLFYLLNTAISASTDIRALVITSAAVPTPATIRDLNFVADLLAEAGVTEAAATNYARVDLANVTVAESDAADNATIVADAPTMTSVGSGETWAAIGYYIEGASDAARELLSVEEPASTIPTNGGNITLPALSLTATGS